MLNIAITYMWVISFFQLQTMCLKVNFINNFYWIKQITQKLFMQNELIKHTNAVIKSAHNWNQFAIEYGHSICFWSSQRQKCRKFPDSYLTVTFAPSNVPLWSMRWVLLFLCFNSFSKIFIFNVPCVNTILPHKILQYYAVSCFSPHL